VIALEGGPKGVTSNTVCPSYVRTLLVDKQIEDQARIHGIPADRVVTDIMLSEPAIKRLIEPAEVAELVAFLCSEWARSPTARPGSSTAADRSLRATSQQPGAVPDPDRADLAQLADVPAP
jgi:NAD(P)-dependent dehydrogenase (short-subunit alcohol dehydrogenase family)